MAQVVGACCLQLRVRLGRHGFRFLLPLLTPRIRTLEKRSENSCERTRNRGTFRKEFRVDSQRIP